MNELVEQIIVKAIAEKGRVARGWVIETIKRHVSPPMLLNAAMASRTQTKDGVKNMQAGAAAIFRSAMRSGLKNRYVVKKDGWIIERSIS